MSIRNAQHRKQLQFAKATQCALFAAAVVATAAFTARADWWAWIGKDNSSAPCYYDDFGTPANGKTNGCCYRSGGSGLNAASFANYNHWIGFTNGGKLTVNPKWDGTITFRALTSQTGGDGLYITEYANPITFVAEDPAYGISGTKLLQLNPGVELAVTSGAYSFSKINVANDSAAGKSSTLTVNGPSASLAASGELSIGYNGGGGSMGHVVVGDGATVGTGANFTLYKGDATINGGNVTVDGTLHIAYRGSGEFTLNEGEVDVATKVHFGGCYASAPTKLSLNGGILSTPTITWNNGSTTANVVFNGGTLKANADGTLIASSSKIAVTVDNGGGVIDNGGFSSFLVSRSPKKLGPGGLRIILR